MKNRQGGYARFVNKVIFPLGLRLEGSEYLTRYKDLEHQQWWPLEKLQNLQLQRLHWLLHRAFHHSPYYRQRFDELGLTPADITNVQDLSRLPILTKRQVQDYQNDLLTDDAPQFHPVRNASGGSTGEPTVFFQSRRRNLRRGLEQFRHDEWSGWQIGDPLGLLWGSTYDLSRAQSLSARLMNGLLYRRVSLDAFHIQPDDWVPFLRRLERARPTALQAYANALDAFARYLDQAGLDGRSIGLRGIISSAEPLDPIQRQRIERVFHCSVFDRYGSREVGLIASECDHHRGLHVNIDNVIVEILRPDGTTCRPGEEGRIVVTDLWSDIFPFIRFDVGDLGSLIDQACTCGRGLPLMTPVKGRTADFFSLPGGLKIHGEYFTHLMYGLPGIEKFQFIQQTPTTIDILYIPGPEYQAQHMDRVIRQIRDFTQRSDLVITPKAVESIAPAASGKHKFTISHVA